MTATRGCSPSSARRVLALVCLAMACAATLAAADPKESYRKGIEAVDQGQWPAVVRFMREAVAQQSAEGERVKLYGVRIVPYLPHFYLGLALSQTGSCEEALTQWQESESQGEVQKTVHYKALSQGRDRCKQKLARAKPATGPGPAPGQAPAPGPDASVLVPAVREADAALQKAAEAEAQLARRRGDPEYAGPWKDESADAVEASAAKAIAAARAGIERAKSLGQVVQIQEATRAVTRSRQELEALAGRLDKLRTDLRQEREREKEAAGKLAEREAAERQAREKASLERLAAEQESAARLAREQEAVRQEAERRDQEQRHALGKEIERLAAEARKLLDRSTAAQPRAADLDRRQTRLEGLLRSASRPPAAGDAAQLRKLRDELSAAITGLEQALAAVSRQAGPPPELRAAARALFRADYGEVVRTLAGVRFAEHRAAVTAALLLAAARYSLYLESGERDPKLRQLAGDDARSCRRLAPALSPDPKLFSPRFVQFFRSPG
jgi:hypothetical protein